MSRQRIVGLVAMQIDSQAALGRDPAKGLHRGGPVRHGAFEVRNASDNINAHVEGAIQGGDGARAAEKAVLGDGDELKVSGRFAALPYVEKRLDGKQPWVAHIYMTANGEQTLSDGEIAIAQCSLNQ